MAIERPTINLSKKTNPTEELRKEFRAKAARVVSRSFLIDRLNVELPSDVYGEWVADNPVSIAEAQALGFEIDKDYATKNKLHSNAAGEAKVGDVIFMTMPKWMKEELDIVKKEEYERHHGVRKGSKPAEEAEYARNISRETPLINESKTDNREITSLVSD